MNNLLEWWLRNAGESFMSVSASYVNRGGYYTSSQSVKEVSMVRPAMRIDLAKCQEDLSASLMILGELDHLPITEIPETEEVTEAQ